MSIKKLETQLEELMEKRDKLEENCDTLPQCQEEDGCDTCKIFEQIEDLDDQIEKIEEQIESMLEEED